MPDDLLESYGFRKAGPRRRAYFLRGPVPLSWLRRAAALPGKALAVGVVLWYLAGRYRRRTVKLTTVQLEGWGISRFAKSRALRALERGELVRVDRRQAKNPVVTIIVGDEHDDGPGERAH